MGRPLYPDQPHRTLGEKKEEPVKEEPIVETKEDIPVVEPPVIAEVVKIIPEPKSKSERKFNLKNLRKKKEKQNNV